MQGGKQQKREFAKYPKYRQAYVRAFDRMVKALEKEGKPTFDYENGYYWKDGESVMRWWVGDDPLQITLEDYMKFLETQERIIEDYK